MIGEVERCVMLSLDGGRRVSLAFVLGALGIAVAGCASAPSPGAGGSTYACYFSDDRGEDRLVDGRTLHWCGPVPKPKN